LFALARLLYYNPSQSKNLAAPTGYACDALDRTTVITYPDGEVVTQTYDNRGLPLALIGDSDYVTQTVRRRRLTTQPGR